MEIFIDTSVIYTDPFWKRNKANELLEAAKNELARIYLPTVVIRELRTNYIKQLNKELASISSANSNIGKLTQNHSILEAPSIDDFLKQFDNFYQQIFTHKSIIEVPASDTFFEEILSRAIEYRKPFTEKRSEFKDAVIWLSCVNYAKANHLSNCCFLTNNHKDFNDDNGNLHKELASDYSFGVFGSIEEFTKANLEIIVTPTKEFADWIKIEQIDQDYVYNLLSEYKRAEIYEQVRNHFDNSDPTDYVSEAETLYLMGGYATVNDVDLVSCTDIDVEIIADKAIISGILLLDAEIELYSYNSERDPGDEKFPYYGSTNKGLKLYFNFIYTISKAITNFEITDVV